MEKKYKLYALDCYNKNKEFIKTNYKEYILDDLIIELNKNKGYHMRIDPEKNYIFFGDCDEFKGNFNEYSK